MICCFYYVALITQNLYPTASHISASVLLLFTFYCEVTPSIVSCLKKRPEITFTGWWQGRKRQWQSQGKSSVSLPEGWAAVPSGSYPQALEDSHNQPRSSRSHSSCVQCSYP
ncbi:hypothetical protein FQN60_017963 [Etheostoma spectabile]|uniref:Uncharacterized protein n=1 Tax=Etheostoma spectabile TaxID=54343 RepID=A0A5J5DGU2_9PERO|nr:hypothetical protein FQN60_017963 [Etheostoma spectabile]